MLKTLHKIRGLAALVVVISHLGRWSPAGASLWHSILIALGPQAVAVFFVISGFIIARSHQRDIGQPARLTGYACKRFFRIYPPYWFFSACFLLIGWLGITGWDTVNIEPRGPLQLLGSIFLLPTSRIPVGFLVVSWSLYYEILFYLVFTAYFFGRIIGGVAIAIFVTLSVINHAQWLIPLLYFNHINILFLSGLILGFRTSYFAGLRITPRALFILGILTYAIALPFPSNRNWPLVYISAVTFIIGAIRADSAPATSAKSAPTPGPVGRSLLWLGTISYSLYLCHVPVQILLHHFIGSPAASLFSPIIYILIPIVVASISYLAIEAPMQKLARRLSGDKSRNPIATPIPST